MAQVEVRGLTKTFGPVTAVREMSFTASAGKVTGFAAAAVLSTRRRDVT